MKYQEQQRAGIEALPVVSRLALAYAPAKAREAFLALLTLDASLAAVLRSTREPILGQLRFAWWREQLRVGPDAWLEGLVDGWEAMLGDPPMPGEAFIALSRARGQVFAALAARFGAAEEPALTTGTRWSLADIAGKLSHPLEQQAARDLWQAQGMRRHRLPRVMRPLAVLDAVALSSGPLGIPPVPDRRMLFAGIRVGLLGR